MSRDDFFKARGGCTVRKVTLEAADAFTADSSNYHTFTVRRVKAGQSNGEDIATAYSLASKSLAANEQITLYDDVNGLAMSDGERLALIQSETGTPAALERVVLWTLVHQNVR